MSAARAARPHHSHARPNELDVSAILHALPVGVRIIAPSGRVVFENEAFTSTVATSSAPKSVERLIDRARQTAVAAGRVPGREGELPIFMRAEGVEIRATLLKPEREDARPTTVVVAIGPQRRAIGEVDLRQAYGLTAREADVARLLSRGLPNRDIAKALGVTTHTARRHTERILAKLGVRSRAEAAASLAVDVNVSTIGDDA